MNEQATLRFEFVSSGGGGGPGPAGLPAPSGSGSAPQPKQELPAASPAAGGGAMSAKRLEPSQSIVDSLKAALSQSGLRSLIPGQAGAVVDAGLATAQKIEGALSALAGSSGAMSAAAKAAPILPASSAAGAATAASAVRTGSAVAASASAAAVASAAMPVAAAVVGSVAFAGMVARAASDIAKANSTFSPDVAVANALAEARTIRRQVDLGKVFGADSAAAIDAQSRIEDNLIRGSQREIAAWNRLNRTASELAETASELYARENANGNNTRRAKGASRWMRRAGGGLNTLFGFLGVDADGMAGYLEAIETWMRKSFKLQERAERRAEEQFSLLFKKVQPAPLPPDLLWAEGRSDIPIGVKFNGPQMWNP